MAEVTEVQSDTGLTNHPSPVALMAALSPLMTYLLALAALVAAVALRAVLDPLMGDSLPLVTIFGAVAGAVWVGGYRPAIVVVVLGYIASNYFFIPPRGVIDFDAETATGLIAYLFTCALIIAFGQAVRSATGLAGDRTEMLRVTLRSIGDAVITTDNSSTVTYVNSVAESLTGWSVHEAIGQPLNRIFRIVNQNTGQPVENPATRALREGVVVGLANHTVLIRKDGSECPIDDSAAPIKDERGKVSGCVLIFRDVTAQRLAERLRAERLTTARMLANIVETSDDAILSKTLDGTIRSWNAGAERLFGYTEEEAVGRHISMIIPPERLAEEDLIISRLREGRRVEHFETERCRSDGSRIRVSLAISPLRNESGEVIGASKIVRDITMQRQAEADLRTLANDLADAARRKDEFLAILAHELRNPLAPISNAVQVLRLRGANGDGQAVHAATEMLQRQVSQMARLVDDLLDMTRITRGKIELRKERLDLKRSLNQAVEATSAQYRSMNHQLTVQLPFEPILVDADAARIAQVVGNLLNNACKFTDKGGHIRLSVERSGKEAIIRVRDSGIGIAAQDIPKLFQMFSQVDTSLERSRDGLGIGLTLVKTIAELHGGSVEVQSEGLGHGSEFIVKLPLVSVDTELESSSTSDEPPLVQSRRILIVDDNEDGANSLAMLLQLSGHQAFIARDGFDAIESAESIRPDAVLMDIGLPGMNGYEVCTRIRQEPWGKDLLLLALTGWGQDEDRQRSKESGFDAHMVKPVDHVALFQLLNSLPAAT